MSFKRFLMVFFISVNLFSCFFCYAMDSEVTHRLNAQAIASAINNHSMLQLKNLIENGIDIAPYYPLHFAINRYMKEGASFSFIINELLHFYPYFIQQENLKGYQPISLAIRGGNSGLVFQLCRAGASLDNRNSKGENLIFQAIKSWVKHSQKYIDGIYTEGERNQKGREYSAIILFLKDHGVDILAVNNENTTAVCYALKYAYYPEIFKLLIFLKIPHYGGTMIISDRITNGKEISKNPERLSLPVWSREYKQDIMHWIDNFDKCYDECITIQSLLDESQNTMRDPLEYMKPSLQFFLAKYLYNQAHKVTL